jgi:hypothetical protein
MGTHPKFVSFLGQSVTNGRWYVRVPTTVAISFVPDSAGVISTTSFTVDVAPSVTGTGSGNICKVLVQF